MDWNQLQKVKRWENGEDVELIEVMDFARDIMPEGFALELRLNKSKWPMAQIYNQHGLPISGKVYGQTLQRAVAGAILGWQQYIAMSHGF